MKNVALITGASSGIGKELARIHANHKGDLVLLEHYLPCMQCKWDHMGEYRHCESTDWHYNADAIRYGYTSVDTPPSLWGGYSQYLYLPHNAIVHKVPVKGRTILSHDGVRRLDRATAAQGSDRKNTDTWATIADPGSYQETVHPSVMTTVPAAAAATTSNHPRRVAAATTPQTNRHR